MGSTTPIRREQMKSILEIKQSYFDTGMEIPELTDKVAEVLGGGEFVSKVADWIVSCKESDEVPFPEGVPVEQEQEGQVTGRKTRSSSTKGKGSASVEATGSKRKERKAEIPPSKRPKSGPPAQIGNQKKVQDRNATAKKRVAALNGQAEHNEAVRKDSQGHLLGTSPEYPLDEMEYRFASDIKLPHAGLWSRTATNFRFVNSDGHPSVALPGMKISRLFMIAACGSLNGEYEGGVRLACGYWNVDVDPVRRAQAAPAKIIWLKVAVKRLEVEHIDLMGNQPRDTLVVHGEAGHYVLQSPDMGYYGRWQLCREYFDPYDNFQDANFAGEMPPIFPVKKWWTDLKDEYRRLIAAYGADALNPEMPKMGRAERQLVKAEIELAIAECHYYDIIHPLEARICQKYRPQRDLTYASRSKKRDIERRLNLCRVDAADLLRETASQIAYFKGIVAEKQREYHAYRARPRKALEQASQGGRESDEDSDSDSVSNGESDSKSNDRRDDDDDDGDDVQAGPSQPSGGQERAITPPPSPSSRATSRQASPPFDPSSGTAEAALSAHNHATSPPPPPPSTNSVIGSGRTAMPPPHSHSMPPPEMQGRPTVSSTARHMSVPAAGPQLQSEEPTYNPQVVVLPQAESTENPASTTEHAQSAYPPGIFGDNTFGGI